MAPDSDASSVFSYDGEGPSDTFSLVGLRHIVDAHFGKKCSLVKMAQGGYHKIYDILEQNEDGQPGRSLQAIARVASPAFPRDKLWSEASTLQYIASRTSVPVPTVYEWSADASNKAGAEYMIMQKIPGTPADSKWTEGLPFDIKEKVVIQIAEHLASLFALRFDKAGSLYYSSNDLFGKSSAQLFSSQTGPQHYRVGPVVSTWFYRALDGCPDYPSTDLHVPGSPSYNGLQTLRGPFTRTSDFLSHHLRALLYKCTTFPVETARELDEECQDDEHAARVLDKVLPTLRTGIELVEVYPGDATVCTVSTPDRPFTFWWDDFRLINVMIDEATGTVTGLIDFEGTMLAPTWRAAAVPQWIPNPDGDTANWYGGTAEEQRRLWNAFHRTMDRCGPQDWREAYEKGEAFREVANRAEMGVKVWQSEEMEQWATERIRWATEDLSRAGMPMPEPDILAYLEDGNGNK